MATTNKDRQRTNKKYVLYVPHSRVHKSMAEQRSNFGDSAITKGQNCIFFIAHARNAYISTSSQNIWRHPRVPRCQCPIRWRNFGDSAINKDQIAYFYCSCAKQPYFYFLPKVRRYHHLPRPQFPIKWRNFGDTATSKGKLHIFLRMRKTATFLLTVKNLTSPSCSPTPISD